MKVTVLGTGYLGAVHAAAMAEIGHDVLGMDVDPERVEALAAGRAPFFEPGFPQLLQRALASGRLRFSTSTAAAAAHGDVHFVCVGTPQRKDGPSADLRFVEAVIDDLAEHLTRPCLVVGKSTVPVGTAAALATRLSARAPVGADARLAWNPEFLREGHAVQDTLFPDRLVLGVTHHQDEDVLRRLYAGVIANDVPCLVTDLATAELVKIAANAFLATKISFINAMAEVCEKTGGDVVALADAIGYDVRIGRKFLNAGIGFGGGCLPKDIRAFVARADELDLGTTLSFLTEVDRINLRRRERAVHLARHSLGGDLRGRRVAVLGAAFKPDSDDVRDSPALAVAAELHRQGAQVLVHDPQAVERARAACPQLDYTCEVGKAIEGSELVLHLTEWAEYRHLDPQVLAAAAATPRLIDGRNALDLARWHAAGWAVQALGRRALATPDQARQRAAAATAP